MYNKDASITGAFLGSWAVSNGDLFTGVSQVRDDSSMTLWNSLCLHVSRHLLTSLANQRKGTTQPQVATTFPFKLPARVEKISISYYTLLFLLLLGTAIDR